MRPFDPHLLRTAPAARKPVAVLAVVGVLQGVATIALAFAVTALVVAVVRGAPLTTPIAWTSGLFATRAMLAMLTQRGFRTAVDPNPAIPTLSLVYGVRPV
jgi:hypothetical protein